MAKPLVNRMKTTLAFELHSLRLAASASCEEDMAIRGVTNLLAAIGGLGLHVLHDTSGRIDRG
jgi:hypothetical protein